MIRVAFPETVEDSSIRFSVIVARMNGRWLFCRHKDRSTLECPGGHREPGETPEETARRELYEETGAIAYRLTRIGPYTVKRLGGSTGCGMLYRAEVDALGPIPAGSEIAQVLHRDELPEAWTYPDIQPYLLKQACPEAALPPRHTTAAYVMDRQGLTFRDEDAPMLDQLNFSFALVKDGMVTGDHWRSIDAYKAYIAKHPHILPVVSVGGWGAGGFSEAASTREGRERFVSSALALMEQHGFYGLDVDWEYPCSSAAGIASSPADRENFTLLLKALRNGLDAMTAKDGKNRLLACALGASASLADSIQCCEVTALVDQVNLMTYDMYTPHRCAHHTALLPSDAQNTNAITADEAVAIYTAAGIDRSKIMLGCALYARVFEHDGLAMAPLYAASPSNGSCTMPYFRIRQETGLSHRFDETCKAAYAYDATRFLTYDSPRSIACKRDYVRTGGLMGLMCWEYGEDADGELLRAMHG